MRLLSIRHVRAALAERHLQIRRDHYEADLEGGSVDVRLQVYPDGQYAIRTGDASYDLDHNGYWGSASLPWRNCNLTDIARDLIDQARDHHAQTHVSK